MNETSIFFADLKSRTVKGILFLFLKLSLKKLMRICSLKLETRFVFLREIPITIKKSKL